MMIDDTSPGRKAVGSFHGRGAPALGPVPTMIAWRHKTPTIEACWTRRIMPKKLGPMCNAYVDAA